MNDPQSTPAGSKPKKSVALSCVVAGNTALCAVGRTGNDLHYRGYNNLDVAEACEFEEIAYLLVHGKLPTQAELRQARQKEVDLFVRLCFKMVLQGATAIDKPVP